MSFLSRLARTMPESARAGIVRNLNQVLNAKKGYGSVMSGFGLGDFETRWSNGELQSSLTRELEEAVRRYEPRLVDPLVVLIGSHRRWWIRWRLSGTVAGAEAVFAVDMDIRYRDIVVAPQAEE
ncbi:GPW/gp25 family protein [Haliangium sp.]|uniref:GPW/gp25 family protein n=1 Tax=Haliangium sp. TaxID=2663208 RepID=UPI003D09929F